MPNETDFVQPSSPPRETLRWPLTAIDQFALRWLIQGTWVFTADLDVPRLKHGLATLLDAYPILCGRVTRGSTIEYRNGGVPFTLGSTPDLGVDDFDATTTDVKRFADRRKPRRIKRGRDPLMTVKLTKLRDGWVVAVCGSHACLDGNGFYSMVRNWSRAVSGQSFPQPHFERPQDSLTGVRSKEEVARSAREAGWQKLSFVGMLRYMTSLPGMLDREFVAQFSSEALGRCKHALVRDSGCERLSTNSALIAHLARCGATLLDLDPRSCFAVSAAVDQRGRVAGLSEEFAGNAVSVVVAGDIPGTASRGEIATRLQRELEPMQAKPSAELAATARLTAEVAHHRLPFTAFSISKMLGRRPSLLYTNSFQKFPIYDLDFGDGARPVRSIPHNLGDPVLLWPAPASTGGIELYFSGALARAVRALSDTDPWWAELGRFEAEAKTEPAG